VQRLLKVQGVTDQVHVAGITYDPGFDLPARLRAYAEERGVELGGSCRMFRSAQFGILRNHFGLGVSFLGSLVNRHRIELFLLDPQGRTAARFERFRWSPDEVATRAIELLHEPSMAAEPADPESRSQSAIPPLARSLTSTAASSIALVLLPKCPACWAAYASLAGFAGATAVPLPLVRTLLLAGFGISLLALIFAARASRRRASRVTQDSPL
jgi:protein SCO1/2